jgi:biopolymer transport protein ExbD
MAMQVGQNKGGAIADINVTPLVDVVLVLLVIFMVVSHMLTSGVDVPLPVAKTSRQAQDSGQHLVISINESGAIFVDTRQVSLETLIDEVNAEFRKDPNSAILIKGDQTLHYGEVRAVMDTLAEGGMTTLLLATEKKED